MTELAEELMSILRLPERRFTIPRSLGIAVNLTRAHSDNDIFNVLEDERTRVENGDLFIDVEELGEDEARKVVGTWIACLGFKHVKKAAVAGVAGDRLVRLMTSIVKERYPGKLNVYVSTLPSRDETPYRIYATLCGSPLVDRCGVTVLIDHDRLWNEMILIDSGKRKTPRQVIVDLLSTVLPTMLNEEVYEKLKKFQIRLFIPAIMYSVSDEVFDSLKGMLRIIEYTVLTGYKREDVEYALLYVYGTGFEKNEDKVVHEFQEWALNFKNLVDLDIICRYGDKRRIVLFLGVKRLDPEKYRYISEKCFSIKNVVENLSPAIEVLEFLGLK